MAGQHHREISPQEQKRRGLRVQSRAAAAAAQSLSRAHSLQHYVSARKKRLAFTILKRSLIGLSLALVCMVGVAFAYISSINAKITGGVGSSLKAVLSEKKFNEPFYMLLLGIDKDEGRASGTEYGASDSAYRTDTIILARIDPSNLKVTLISIPRDTQVDLDEHGTQKINSAYTFGGPEYTVQVVSKLAGVQISHYAQVDMDGFAAVVDAVGGVDVNLPQAVKDPNYTGLDLPAGEQHLDGRTAGLLGRSRHAYDNQNVGGDFIRAANQRMLIGAVVKKLLASDPLTMANAISTGANYVKTDMSVQDILALATQFTGFNVDTDLYSGACPTKSEYINNLWYEIVDESAWKTIMERVDKGLAPYTDASQDFTAGLAGAAGVSTQSEDGSSNSSSGELEPVMSGNVLVLNGSGTKGLAANVSNKLTGQGFSCAADNAPAERDDTVVYYNAADGKAKALGVIKALGLSVEPKQNDGSVSQTQDVVVILGKNYKS